MKKNQKKYDLSLRSKSALKIERCNRAANRGEKYDFKDKYGELPLSYELKGNLVFKQEFYSKSDNGGSIWSDRTSDISAPLGSELFLMNERSMPETMLGAPRFYFHELDNRDEVPDARGRFPYDRVAHAAAKTITRMFRRNLNRKNAAATIIQRNIKLHVQRVSARLEVKYWKSCVEMIQRVYLNKKQNLRRNSIRRKAEISSASLELKLRAQIIAQKRMDAHEERRQAFMFMCVTRLARNFIHRRRKARAIAKREMIYARRLQANFRGRKQRRLVKRMLDARIFIIYWWRKHWRRKYKTIAIKIQRAFRRKKLLNAVIRIQMIVRRKLGWRSAVRKRLALVAEERARTNREFIVIARNLKEISQDLNWMSDDEQVPPISMADHMRRLDLYSLAVLTANPLQLSEEEFKTIHPAEFGEDDYAEETVRLHSVESDSLPRRIVIAVLNLFANRPGGCLDRAAMLVCRDLLRPSGKGGLSVEAWKNLPNYPMINVNNLSQVVEPSKALLMRVIVAGQGRYIPAGVLAKAVLVNRWTMHYEWITRQQIVKFRKQFPTRRMCKFCMEPLLFDTDVHDHRRCFRNGYFSWIQKALESIVEVLVNECRKLEAPPMKRSWMQDNEKLKVALQLMKQQTDEAEEKVRKEGDNAIERIDENGAEVPGAELAA